MANLAPSYEPPILVNSSTESSSLADRSAYWNRHLEFGKVTFHGGDVPAGTPTTDIHLHNVALVQATDICLLTVTLRFHAYKAVQLEETDLHFGIDLFQVTIFS